jgi:hypothetical protein
MAFAALLDACVLYPVGVRDLLLSVAERGVYVPYWNADILDEMERKWWPTVGPMLSIWPPCASR